MVKILPVILAICCLLASCNRPRKNDVDQTSKLQFSAEINPVAIMVLRQDTFNKELVTNGKVYARKKSTIGFKTAGVVETINVRNGDYIGKGDVIAVLDNTDALNGYRNALENFEKSKIDLNDAIIGFGYHANDTLEVAEEVMSISRVRSGYNISELSLESAREVLENCTLKAPFSGKVANLKAREFERVGDEFCTIIDDGGMIAEFHVFESELGVISPGQQVRISSFFDQDSQALGKVTSINPTVDERGQVLVHAEFTNRHGYIDGMNVKVFAESTIPDQLVVPKSAVVIRDNLEVLFRYSQGKTVWTYVNILNENSHSYVVTANTARGADLTVGDSIIISGNLNLAHDSAVLLQNN